MKIVIIGAGAVGFQLAQTISRRDHDVTLVENEQDPLDAVAGQLDCRLVQGSGVSPAVLREIGMRDCDLFAAVTNRDEINIIACQTAHALGARVKVARVREEEYYQDHRLLLDGIDMALNPDHEAVYSIREILLQTGATEVHDFAGGKVRIIGAKVEPASRVDGKALARLNKELGESMALVTTIVRNGQTLIPSGKTVLQAGDMVFMAGSRSIVNRSLIHFQAERRRLEHVMIVGANAMGRELARDLLTAGVAVKIIDPDEEKCLRASQRLRHALVLHGEGTDASLLEEEGVGDMDAFVAVAHDEETNIMSCLLARHHGAARTMCLVNRPDYVPLLPLLGVDAAVSPRLATSDWIAGFVQRGAVVSSESLGLSDSQILQLEIGPGCDWLGRPLKDLSFPADAVIGAVLKRGRVVTPTGGTVLAAGDQVVVFALPAGVEEAVAFFTGSGA